MVWGDEWFLVWSKRMENVRWMTRLVGSPKSRVNCAKEIKHAFVSFLPYWL